MRFDVRYVVMCDANQQCWFNTNMQHSVCKFWSYYLTVLCCLLLEIYCILVFGYLWLCVYGRECECYSALSILSIRFMFRYFATFICFAIYFAMPCIAIVHQICLLWTRSHSHRIYLLAITLECISITCCDRKLCVWTSKTHRQYPTEYSLLSTTDRGCNIFDQLKISTRSLYISVKCLSTWPNSVL